MCVCVCEREREREREREGERVCVCLCRYMYVCTDRRTELCLYQDSHIYIQSINRHRQYVNVHITS